MVKMILARFKMVTKVLMRRLKRMIMMRFKVGLVTRSSESNNFYILACLILVYNLR